MTMLSSPRVKFFFLLILAVLFAVGIQHLLLLRFHAGDSYPEYSTFRSDPRGAKAFYECLRYAHPDQVERSFQVPGVAPYPEQGTLYLLGLRPGRVEYFQGRAGEALKAWTARGGRLVVTFRQDARFAQKLRKQQHMDPQASGPDTEDTESDAHEADTMPETDLPSRRIPSFLKTLGFSFKALQEEEMAVARETPAQAAPGYPVPATLRWNAPLVLQTEAPSWQPVYTWNGHPVVITRSFGRGEIILAADSFMISNEGLWLLPVASLLEWLQGSGPTWIFDESHLGILRSDTVAQLIGKYGLHRFFSLLALIAALWIGQASSPLIPRQVLASPSSHQGLLVSGRASEAGFQNLLKRFVPTERFLPLCYQEWKQSLKEDRLTLASRQQAMESALHPGKRLRWGEMRKIFDKCRQIVKERNPS